MSIQKVQARRSHVGFIALLLAALAVAFGAMLWDRDAKADIPSATVSVSDNDADNVVAPGAPITYTITVNVTGTPGGTVTNANTSVDFADNLLNGTVTNATGLYSTGECMVQGSNVVSCTDTGGPISSATVTVQFNAPGSGAVADIANCSITDDGVGAVSTCQATPGAITVSAAAGATVNPPTITTIGADETVTFTLSAGVTCASDADATPDADVECTPADVQVTGDVVLVSGPTVTDPDTSDTTTVEVVVRNNGTGGSVALSLKSTDTGATFTSPAAAATTDITNVDLRHIAIDPEGDAAVIDLPDLNNNVRGARHTVCAVDETSGAGVQIPIDDVTDINIQSGGGYTSVNDPDPTFTDPQFFVGDGEDGIDGATCFSWVSTEAGDQEISAHVTIDGTVFTVDFDSDGTGNNALVKEWNVLETSEPVAEIEQSSQTQTADQTANLLDCSGPATDLLCEATIGLVQDPVTGQYFIPGGVLHITDQFVGSHVTRTGSKVTENLSGVEYEITFSGCGEIEGATDGVTFNDANGEVVGVDLDFFADIGSSNVLSCIPGETATITITGNEPSPLGSGTGNEVTETIVLNFTAAVNQKQVLLAWAGQRVILEHDWRLPAGDDPDLENAGFCPLFTLFDDDVPISYVKGSGPGNFLPSLGAVLNGSDQATVFIDEDADSAQVEDAPIDPAASCISRVLFESEDPGEVDIEAFIDDEIAGAEFDIPDASKIAFVVYYMKINTVNVSLVTQASKPTHNSSAAPDYVFANAGNPWNAAADDADNTTDWNVSTDLLVRGRVTGWFLNSNPSGRPADTSNPLNVLPANRWVMPNDWALLAGGPADNADGSPAIGTAEQFRPYYDLLFGPDQSTIALLSPTGQITGADDVRIGSATFDNCDPDVPFEGPYSLIDIPGFAFQNGCAAGAALSNLGPDANGPYTTGYVRDTVAADGDVNVFDAPMPPLMVSVSIRGAGFIKQVLKQDVYYTGTANAAGQEYRNPFYFSNIPDSPYIPAVVAGGGYLWNSWGNDGPDTAGCASSFYSPCDGGNGAYNFWQPVRVGVNSQGIGEALTSAQQTELEAIRDAYGDGSIARDLVVYTDNHGEFMVTANGDFNLSYDECAANTLGGGILCAPGDHVGTSSITATADYPDFRGKHFPVASNTATVNWTWGGYKDVTIEQGEDPQIRYVVFHSVDRDGFCDPTDDGAVSLHPVLSGAANDTFNGNPAETVDFLIDSDEGGIILSTSGGGSISVTAEFATGVPTFSKNDHTGLEFPNSPLASSPDADECQAYVRISNSLLDITNVLVIAHNDPPETNVTFDRIVDFQGSASLTLNFRWSLVTWLGANDIPVNDAISGTGANEAGNDISDQVTAIYGWNAASQDWLGYFPEGVGVPGANDLVTLETGQAYWVAIKGPDSVTWTIATNVD
ncbi:MAG: hypothetical protein ACM3S1_11510 [Hyphomicrobiales bacterium]